MENALRSATKKDLVGIRKSRLMFTTFVASTIMTANSNAKGVGAGKMSSCDALIQRNFISVIRMVVVL
eukprot:10177376-Ditylum_brightwellii.AAC.1